MPDPIILVSGPPCPRIGIFADVGAPQQGPVDAFATVISPQSASTTLEVARDDANAPVFTVVPNPGVQADVDAGDVELDIDDTDLADLFVTVIDRTGATTRLDLIEPAVALSPP